MWRHVRLAGVWAGGDKELGKSSEVSFYLCREKGMKKTQRALVLGGVALFAAITAGPATPAGGAPDGPKNNILAREFAIEAGQAQVRAARTADPGAHIDAPPAPRRSKRRQSGFEMAGSNSEADRTRKSRFDGVSTST